jgi:HlyD family secretion protein
VNRRPWIIAVSLLALLAIGFWVYKKSASNDGPIYRFATVERGDLEAAVSATGTLSAVTTVQVGTQVSGKIVEMMADFNDRVKKGQLVARIDPTILQQTVRDAQAGLERNQAELEQAEREYARNEGLFQRKVLTEIEFNNAKYALAVARANVKSAQVAVDRAKQNLAYTEIFAPIDGIVVERNVDVGQTVVASMSTPQLFLIAKDLSQMQILASVDESDIGSIHEGQSVRFSVQAYPNQRFEGTVKQVRLQSKTTENVVNYTVVVLVNNKSGKLLPGMTATAEFLTGTVQKALLVPNSALRFRPTEEMRAEVFERLRAQREAAGASEHAEGGQFGGDGANGASGGRRAQGAADSGEARDAEAGGAHRGGSDGANGSGMRAESGFGERGARAGGSEGAAGGSREDAPPTGDGARRAAGGEAASGSRAGRAFGSAEGARGGDGANGASGSGMRAESGFGERGVRAGGSEDAAGGARGGRRFGGGQQGSMLWYLDEKGQLTMTRVRAGLTDGQKTAVESPRIKEGMQVIIGVSFPAGAQAQAFGQPSPFAPAGGPPGGGPRRF